MIFVGYELYVPRNVVLRGLLVPYWVHALSHNIMEQGLLCSMLSDDVGVPPDAPLAGLLAGRPGEGSPVPGVRPSAPCGHNMVLNTTISLPPFPSMFSSISRAVWSLMLR